MATSPRTHEFRPRAERMRQQRVRDTRDLSMMSIDELRGLLQELQVHQIELKAQNAKLRREADELRAVLDAIPAAVWISRDPDGCWIAGNRAAHELLHTPENVEGAPEGLPLRKATRGAEVRNTELRIVLDDGSVRYLYGNTAPLKNEDGKVCGAVAAFVDITERKQAEAAAYESEARQHRIINTLPMPVAYIDRHWQVRFHNDQTKRLLDESSEHVTAISFAHRLEPSTINDLRNGLHRALAGQTVRCEALGTFCGRKRHLEVTLVPDRDVDGRIVGVCSLVNDISDLKRTEAALREIKEKMERANTAKGRLLAAASHDLRQPLQALGMLVAVLSQRILDEESRTVVRRVQEALDQMERLLSAFFEAFRLDVGTTVSETKTAG